MAFPFHLYPSLAFAAVRWPRFLSVTVAPVLWRPRKLDQVIERHKNVYELARIRTWNLLIRSQTRYPLRHAPVSNTAVCEISSQQARGTDTIFRTDWNTYTSMWSGHSMYHLGDEMLDMPTPWFGEGKKWIFPLCLSKTSSRWRLGTWVGDRLGEHHVL